MKLNLGCGNDYRDGWVNVDRGECRADVRHDIEVFPWPFGESTATEICLRHIMEHIERKNFPLVMAELHRVCANGAVVVIDAPAAGSNNFWTDPTHQMPLTVRTFDFFDPSKPLYENGRIYGWGDITFSVTDAREISNPPNGPDIHFKLVAIKK